MRLAGINAWICVSANPEKILWWLGTESNRRHADFQSAALPTELPSRSPNQYFRAGETASNFRYQFSPTDLNGG